MDSYLGWWRNAGLVDAVSDAPCDWFAAPAQPKPAAEAARAGAVMTSSRRELADRIAPVAHGRQAAAQDLPGTLPDFDAWLATSADLPGADWSPRCLPSGPAGARIMLLSDAPDVADVTAATLFAGTAGRLLDAMLAAIGETRAGVRLASIAATRPVGGRLDGVETAVLVAIARHQVALVKPRILLLLGQQTAQLFESFQPDVNQDGTTMVTLSIHHPRLLLERPAIKRQIWDALKSLREPG